MQAQTNVAEAVEVFGATELSLEPQVARPLVVQPAANLPSTVVTPADVLRVAMEAGDKDIDRLERLMAMQERHREAQERDRQRDAEIAFEADFVGFTGENVSIPKTKEVDRGRGGKFMQAEFDEVCRRLKPALSKHGFGFRHKERFGPHTPDGAETAIPWVWVTCILSHRAGHKDLLELDSPADDQTANSLAQNSQSTASYLKRQSLLAITGTATGGEDSEAGTGNSKRKEGGEPDAAEGPGEVLLDAGRAAAMNGTEALTAWWKTLSARQQKDMNGDFAGLRKAARAADQGAAR